MPEESQAIEDLIRIREEFNRLLKLLAETGVITRSPVLGNVVEVPLDMVEQDGMLHMYIDLPGVNKDELSVSVLRDVIIIEGRKAGNYPEARRFFCLERNFGTIQRLIEIPRAIDTHALKAKYSKGVLHIYGPIITERRGGRKKLEIEFS